MRRTFHCFVVASFALSLTFLGACGGCGDDGNNTNPDGPLADATPDGPPTEEEVCEVLPALASGTCEVATGNTTTLIKGIVLTPSKIFRGGQVAVNATGQITCVGCACAVGGETTVTCPDGVVSPGLINTHDHITFTQNPPYTEKPAVRYNDRQQWRKGDGAAFPKIPASGGASSDQIAWGELRFVMGGATSIVGSGGQKGFLLNLDQAANEEGLNQPAVNFDTFPLDDSSGTRRAGDCNYGGQPTTAASIAGDEAYEPHTSEGVDSTARNEFLCQSSTTFDTMAPGISDSLVLPKTAMIHAVGLTPPDYAAMAAGSTGLIWSPRSNITLYGDTARVTTAARLGVSISLGTDWMPTGSMNLLRELKCADEMNSKYYNKFFSDQALWQMVTANAAQATKTDDVIGTLAVGKVADISIFNGHGKTFRAIIDAAPADVALVMRAGKILYGDDGSVSKLAVNCDVVDVCGTSKRVCAMGEVGKTFAALKTAAGTAYDAFKCEATPPMEPACLPRRPSATAGSTVYTGEITATDSDGDGIPNATDKCPNVFDPIRPLDNGVQGDTDNDGVGDACDVCPLDANTNTCSTANPDDRDNDGVPNADDNCPDTANTDQADTDGDHKGNVCDACPTEPNPGAEGCTASIYAVKTGVIPVGATVHITNALVTGKGASGFFVQVKMGDTGYTGADNSGLFVYTGPAAATLAAATVGFRVTVDGKVANFQGQIELDTLTAVTATTSVVEPAPTPVTATYAEIKTGGTRATKLEGVIVTLGPSTTTAVDTMFGEVTVAAGADTLVVDDFLFAQASPSVGKAYNALTGVLALRQMASKLEPRSAADLTLGAPTIASFEPALSFAKVGQTNAAPTFPQPLTVTLTGPATVATTITITSANAALTATNVTIPMGATSGVVNVTAVSQNADVLVTAMLGLQMATAHVRVVGAAELPSMVTLSPTSAAVAMGGSVPMTVTLDVPAPAGGTVVGIVESPTSGTFLSIVTVPANAISATFTYTNTIGTGTSTLTATMGGSTSQATITVNTGADHLVINEVDYDQPSTDTAEFVELYNPSATTLTLTGKQLVFINGSDGTTYETINLTGTLASHAYLVFAGPNITAAAGSTKIDPGWTSNAIQNGPPDGIAIIDPVAHTVIDALSYEGLLTAVDLAGFPAPVSFVEGTAATAKDESNAGSLCRKPDGQDTDMARAVGTTG
ncbi:MAG: amidohydrolase family protein [Proteobacteria bacterium]|nr:amidohydrolase family protein [Pseudomonadota bacterium]